MDAQPPDLLEYTPSQLLSIALAVAGAAIYLKVGLRGIVFALIGMFAFSYMAHLLERSRLRSQQYASLSWGCWRVCCGRWTCATSAPPGMPPRSPGSRVTSPRPWA